uniref:Protein FAM161A n=1 Tax=Pipistrellus kuhlii TaxID=59472 RepID=A0A7J7VUJ0_PIPKU|nr:FAM161 centrosomal protein A [Pipistrellus kuhlii]
MAASPRAELAASGVPAPVNPSSPARAARDADPLEDLAAAVRALEDEEEEEEQEDANKAQTDFNIISGVNNLTCMNYEAPLDFSDIYHSNEEYFRKLEELKTAHMETMAKLEKMYQHKLNLKKVQPVIIRDEASSVSSMCVSEKNYCPISLITSLSEPDLGHSSSLIVSSSEDELPNLENDHPEKSRMMIYAKELINNMWTNFSVKDYIHCEDADLPAVKKTRKKSKEWVPKITIPEPFQMMIREEKKKEENMKYKPDIETADKLLKKQEDSECKKKFRANPVPEFVFLPLYHERVKQNEERRRTMKEKNKEALLASLKPFKFIAREEQKRAIREKQLRDFIKAKKKTNRFKARPIPRSTYGSTTNNRFIEEELFRNFKKQLRAQELSPNSSPPPYSPPHRSFAARKPKDREHAERAKCKCKSRCQSADCGEPPERCQKHLSEQKSPKVLLAFKPSDPHAASHASTKREKISADNKADEENLKETHWAYQFLRHKSPVRSPNAKRAPYNCKPPMPTVSSRGREQAARKSEKERMREYQRELEEREEKLKHRPLLFQRVAQKNARMAAEKHYSNTLKALGISDEFVSKKGQSGKIFESFSNQEVKSFTEDKESFNEEENIEERENGEENYFTETNSQDSCKENEAEEESGEEKSVEE